MSLRTVALETPSDRVWAIDWDATGCAVWTYSSTIARSTAARRSVASIVAPPACRSDRWLAVDCTDCYRGQAERVTPRAAVTPSGPARATSRRAVTSEASKPAAPGEDGAVADPVEEAGGHERLDGGPD